MAGVSLANIKEIIIFISINLEPTLYNSCIKRTVPPVEEVTPSGSIIYSFPNIVPKDKEKTVTTTEIAAKETETTTDK
jgi:hypothetical protein